MVSVLGSSLANKIINNNTIFDKMEDVINDLISRKIELVYLIESLGEILTSPDTEKRQRGMRFFTIILKELPKDFLTEVELKFISRFYIDRLKEHHSVIPTVLEGYLSMLHMTNYPMIQCKEFVLGVFKEISCQSHVKEDRRNLYLILKKILEDGDAYFISMRSDFVTNCISAMDGERDPHNLLFLFTEVIPILLTKTPPGHCVEDLFELLSCYFPIDFHPSPDDPAAVTREKLANALRPCLCALPEFAEYCLVLIVDKIESTLTVARKDSLRLLKDSCKAFDPFCYEPFLKTLWSAIYRDINQKGDNELQSLAHEALTALVALLSVTVRTDQRLKNFLNQILLQVSLAGCTTVDKFCDASKILLTVANASRQSCKVVTKAMIPIITSMIHNTNQPSCKLQIACIDFAGNLYHISEQLELLEFVEDEVKEILQLCLNAINQPVREYQMAGLRLLIGLKDAIGDDVVVPLLEILVHNILYPPDRAMLNLCIRAVHELSKKFPDVVLDLVVKEKCGLENLTQLDTSLDKRLTLLSYLISIDEFTNVIMREMLKSINSNDETAAMVIENLREAMSDESYFTPQKFTQIEREHSLVNCVLELAPKRLVMDDQDTIEFGICLVISVIGGLPQEMQEELLDRHAERLYEKASEHEMYFRLMASLCISVHQTVFHPNFEKYMGMALRLALQSDVYLVRSEASVMSAHILNKAESGPNFTLLYEKMKHDLELCDKTDERLYPRLIHLYGWITKALLLRGNAYYKLWLQTIMESFTTGQFHKESADAIRIVSTTYRTCLNKKDHCQITLLHYQRLYEGFKELCSVLGPVSIDARIAYLMSWANVIRAVPKSAMKNDLDLVVPLMVDSLHYYKKELLVIMLDSLIYYCQQNDAVVCRHLPTLLTRLTSLTRFLSSMDVRIKSLECLFIIANSYNTTLLLPYKSNMILDLAPSLDDNKRLVRNMAVKTRSRWYLVGAPGELASRRG